MPDVAVVGGGITGLATAWFVRQLAPDAQVTVYEGGPDSGGKIATSELAGVTVDTGPDTFLARVPWAVDLCRDLGLEAELVEPATNRAYIWTRGRLRPLPAGTVLGVPTRLVPLARSGIVSRRGLARAGLDLVLPRRPHGDDPTVAEVVGGRFGAEVVDRLVDPLIGGIHAGRADRLSLSAVAPQVAGPGASSRSLLLGLRRAARSGGSESQGPVFLGLRGGMGRLIGRLAEAADDIRLNTPVRMLDELAPARVVLAVPAYAAAPLVRRVSPEAATDLEAIDYASTVTVTLAYRREAVPHPLDGSGFLVPRVDGRLMTACTWITSKWPGRTAAAPDLVFLRVFAGRIGDDRAIRLEKSELVERLVGELTEVLGVRGGPEASLVTPWPRSLPQYDVGHQARVDRIERALTRDAPGVVVAGAAYRGVGIAACVQQARQAAQAVHASM